MKISFETALGATMVAVAQKSLVVEALPQYANKIPNGFTVPNPEPQGGTWAGVGHLGADGGGPLNPFGVDFAAASHEWTVELCQKDSDGDGRSNGSELGDPDCTWSEGDVASRSAVSHPGILDEPTELKDSCAGYEAPDDEVSLDFVFSAPNEIDSSRTQYICEQQAMDIPLAEGFYHGIKTEVLLDNESQLHHMFVYLCREGATSTDGDRVGEGSYSCGGNESGCDRIGGWAVGPHEYCYPTNVGSKFNFTSSEKYIIKIEAHYDNASGKPQQDQSGMRFFFTPTLRPLEAVVLTTGMGVNDADFSIPPSQSSFVLSGHCPSAITESLDHAVYAYSFNPHMHYYGKSLVTKQYRCGELLGEIGRISPYKFDNQQSYNLPKPIKILPGDLLVTECEYDTSQVDFTIQGGEETTDEMCLNFIGIYPNPKTEENPSFLEVCMTYENGIQFNNQAVPTGFAIGDRDRMTLTRDFQTDPLNNIGDCCSTTDTCDDLYLSDDGGACGVDEDCRGSFACVEGLCSLAPPTPIETPESESEDMLDGNESSSSPSSEFHSGFLLLVVPLLLSWFV